MDVVSREGVLRLCGRCFTRRVSGIVWTLLHEKGFWDCVDVASRVGFLGLCGRCFTRRAQTSRESCEALCETESRAERLSPHTCTQLIKTLISPAVDACEIGPFVTVVDDHNQDGSRESR